jgi:hypothetical protein
MSLVDALAAAAELDPKIGSSGCRGAINDRILRLALETDDPDPKAIVGAIGTLEVQDEYRKRRLAASDAREVCALLRRARQQLGGWNRELVELEAKRDALARLLSNAKHASHLPTP